MSRRVWSLTILEGESWHTLPFDTEEEAQRAARDSFDPDGSQAFRDDESFFWWARNKGYHYTIDSSVVL